MPRGVDEGAVYARVSANSTLSRHAPWIWAAANGFELQSPAGAQEGFLDTRPTSTAK